jgi:hypothetical protein
MSTYKPDIHREKMTAGWNEVAADYLEITVPFLTHGTVSDTVLVRIYRHG